MPGEGLMDPTQFTSPVCSYGGSVSLLVRCRRPCHAALLVAGVQFFGPIFFFLRALAVCDSQGGGGGWGGGGREGAAPRCRPWGRPPTQPANPPRLPMTCRGSGTPLAGGARFGSRAAAPVPGCATGHSGGSAGGGDGDGGGHRGGPLPGRPRPSRRGSPGGNAPPLTSCGPAPSTAVSTPTTWRARSPPPPLPPPPPPPRI